MNEILNVCHIFMNLWKTVAQNNRRKSFDKPLWRLVVEQFL